MDVMNMPVRLVPQSEHGLVPERYAVGEVLWAHVFGVTVGGVETFATVYTNGHHNVPRLTKPMRRRAVARFNRNGVQEPAHTL